MHQIQKRKFESYNVVRNYVQWIAAAFIVAVLPDMRIIKMFF